MDQPIYMEQPIGQPQVGQPHLGQSQPGVWVQQPGTVVQVQAQPPPRPPQREWTTGVCACCHDFKTCLCGMFCLCCLVCQITSRMGECCCVPCIPGGLVAMRTKMRERYNIQGGICKDHCAVSCCQVCVICQMDRELNAMESQGRFCN